MVLRPIAMLRSARQGMAPAYQAGRGNEAVRAGSVAEAGNLRGGASGRPSVALEEVLALADVREERAVTRVLTVARITAMVLVGTSIAVSDAEKLAVAFAKDEARTRRIVSRVTRREVEGNLHVFRGA